MNSPFAPALHAGLLTILLLCGSEANARAGTDGDDIEDRKVGEPGGADDDRRPTAILRNRVHEANPVEVTSEGIPVSGELIIRNERVEISLHDYVRLVLVRNLDLKIAELDADGNSTSVSRARGAFDPEVFATVNGADTERPTASVFTASRSQSLDANLGLRGLLRTGATYGLTFATNYNLQKPSNPFFDFNPSITSSVTLDLTQPLLRGGGAVTESAYDQARLVVQRGDLDLMYRVQLTCYDGVFAYWNLVFELRTRDTAQTALDVATELVGNTASKLRAGVMTDLDLKRVQSEEKRREEELIRAENRLAEAEDRLIALLSPGENLGSWNVEVVPTTGPSEVAAPTPTEQHVVTQALENRQDLMVLQTDLGLADLDLAVANNDLLPQVDFRASYSLSGLSGSLTSGGASSGPRTNASLFRDSLDPIFDSQFERWSIGVDYSYPIGNRAARASVLSARLSKERAVLVLNQQRMVVIRETRTALRDVTDAWARFEASRQGAELATAQYKAEQVRMANQVSTSFEVREAQRDLFEAVDLETRAILDYEIQRARLEQVQGLLAQQYGVLWEAPVEAAGAFRD